MPTVTEVLEPADVELVAEFADILRVGTRNAQNFPLLRECGRSGKAVMEGREKSRAAARYHSGRALFLLLLASCRHSVIRSA